MSTFSDFATTVLASPRAVAETPDGDYTVNSVSTVADIEVCQLSGNRWKIVDRRQPADDPRGLLGFIEEVWRASMPAPMFEVMTLSDGFEFFSFATLREAVIHVAQYVSESPGEHQAGDLAWIR